MSKRLKLYATIKETAGRELTYKSTSHADNYNHALFLLREKFVVAFRNLCMYYDIKEKHIENMLQNYKSNNFEYPQKESLKSPEFCTNFLINLINNGLIANEQKHQKERK